MKKERRLISFRQLKKHCAYELYDGVCGYDVRKDCNEENCPIWKRLKKK